MRTLLWVTVTGWLRLPLQPQEQIIGLSATTIGKNTDFAVSTINVTDRSGANQAIDVLDVALKQVAESRSGLGAVQNRMESTIRNLEVASENECITKPDSRCRLCTGNRGVLQKSDHAAGRHLSAGSSESATTNCSRPVELIGTKG